MKTRCLQLPNAAVIEAAAPLASVGDLLDLIGACRAQDTDLLLLPADRLPDAFFDLRSGYAGELVQKLQNYRIRCAIVLSASAAPGERFSEFMGEANAGNALHFAGDRAQALAWLAG